MGNWLEKYAASTRFWILIVACTYLGYSIFFAIGGLTFGFGLISDHYVYNIISKNPLWWQILYYGSEGLSSSVMCVLRIFAGVFAVYAAFLFWRKPHASMATIRKAAGAALILEAAYLLCLLTNVSAAIGYNLTSQYLFYFDHTPPLMLILGTAIPCLAAVLVIPPCLLKLRAKIKNSVPHAEALKWACLTGLGYLLVLFWLTYSLLWADVMVPYPRAYEQYGLGFILQPANLLSFSLTVFGLLALGIAAVATVLPAIKKTPASLNLTRVGAVLTAVGAYFLYNTVTYYVTGGYAAHPSVWYEVVGPLHNPNLWALTLIFVGVPLMIQGKSKRNRLNQPKANEPKNP